MRKAPLTQVDLPDDDVIRRLAFVGRIRQKPLARLDLELECEFVPMRGALPATRLFMSVGWLPWITPGSLWQRRRIIADGAEGDITWADVVSISQNRDEVDRLGGVISADALQALALSRVSDAPCFKVRARSGLLLIVPMAVVIRAYYATSTTLAEQIFFLRADANDARLWDPASVGFDEEEPTTLRIRPHWRLRSADIPIAARMAATPEGRRGVGEIWRSRLSAQLNGAKLYPRAYPPFVGESTWSVKGRYVSGLRVGERVLLVDEIVTCSAPWPFNRLLRLDERRRRAQASTTRSNCTKRASKTHGQGELLVSDRVGPAGPRGTSARLALLNARFPATRALSIERNTSTREATTSRGKPSISAPAATATEEPKYWAASRTRRVRRVQVGSYDLFPAAESVVRPLFADLHPLSFVPVIHEEHGTPPEVFERYWNALGKVSLARGFSLRHIAAGSTNFDYHRHFISVLPIGASRETDRLVSVVELRRGNSYVYTLETARNANYEHFSLLVFRSVSSSELSPAHLARFFLRLGENGGWWPERRYSDVEVLRVEHWLYEDPVEGLADSVCRAIDRLDLPEVDV